MLGNKGRAAVTCLILSLLALIGATPALASDLQISQYSWTPDPVPNGADTVFSVRATNNGPTVVSNAVVTIAISDRFEVINAPANFPSYCAVSGALGNQTLTCSLPSLAIGIGNSQNFTFTATARNVGTANTTASIAASGNSDSNSANDSLTVTPTVRAGVDLSVTKVASASTLPAGSALSYTLTARNAGPNTTSAVRVVDSLPAASDFQFLGASGSNWSCGASGTTITCDYTGSALAVPATYPAITINGKVIKATNGTITNIASVQSTDSLILDPNGANDSSGPVVVSITSGSDIQATKSMPATIIVGQSGTITIGVRNNGPQSVPTGSTVSDTIAANLTIGTLPGGCALAGSTVTCTAGALASGASASFAIPVTGASTTTGSVTNVATIAAPAGFTDADLSNNSASVSFAVSPANADLAITSKTKGPSPVAPGSPITSTITLSNAGPSTASYSPGNPIVITDTVGASESYVSSNAAWSCSQTGTVITCQSTGTGTLGVGSTMTLSLVTQAVAGTDIDIANTACTDRTAGSQHLPSASNSPTANDCQTATTRATTESADLSVLKDVSLVNSGGWTDNLSVADTDNSFFVRLRVSNISGNVARTVNVADVLPNFLNTGAIITSVVQDSVTSGSMSYSASSGRVSWTLLNLAAGSTETLIFRVDRPFESGTFTNTASVSSPDTTETDGSNNSDSAGYTIAPVADMTINSKAISPNPARVGVNATYVIGVRNSGANTAQGVIVDDTIDPTRFEIIGTPTTTKPGGSCTVTLASGLVHCSLGTFTRAEARQINVVVRALYPFGGVVNGGFPVAHTNRATVTTTTLDANGGTDPNAGNNFFDLTHDVIAPSFDLAITKAESDPINDDPIRFDETANYDVRISNFGPSRATDVLVTDIPAPPSGQTMTLSSVTINPVAANNGLTLQSAPNAGCTASGANYLCKVDQTSAAANFLDPSKQVIFRMVFTLGGSIPSIPTTVSNSVEFTSAEQPVWNGAGADTQTPNNRAVQTTTVLPSTDLEVVSKTRAGALIRNVNEPVDYTIRIRNNGPSPTSQVRVTDALPAGFQLVPASTPATSIPGGSSVSISAINCSGTGSVLCVLDGSFPVGAAEMADITLSIRAVEPFAGALNPVDQTDTATITPGLDSGGNPLSEDAVSSNNSKSAAVRIQAASVAGTVYADNNRNDTIDAGEGINGVTVTLTGLDADNNAITRSVVTSGSGSFLFDRLPPAGPAGYTVTESQPGNYFDRNETAGTSGGSVDNSSYGNGAIQNRITGIALTPGVAATGYIFQEYREATISGFIYRDLNNDGLRSGAGETGYAPADFASSPQLRLTGTDYAGNAVNLTTSVNASGAYSFTGLAPSETVTGYTVAEMIEPTGSGDGKDANGTGVVIAGSSGRISPETIVVGVTNPAANLVERNFGELPTSSLAGRVYFDPNANATHDSGENVGIAAATIHLTGTNDIGETIDCSLTTDATGLWSFPIAAHADAKCRSLRPGTYAVAETPPPGLVHTGAFIGSLGGTSGSASGISVAAPGAGNLSVTGIVVTAGTAGTAYDFGENGQGLSGSVYIDINRNGTRDSGEAGIAGVTVTLSGTTGSGQDVCTFISCTATTNAAGNYSYLNVPGSNGAGYRLVEQAQSSAPLSDYSDGQESLGGLNGSPRGVAGSDQFTAVTLGAGELLTGYDFGEIGGLLGGKVYLDRNDDGAVATGEPGIAGVSITLSGTVASNGQNICTYLAALNPARSCAATTDGNGDYSFGVLPAGTYSVLESQPTAYADGREASTTAGVAINNGSFSSAPASNAIGNIVLVPGADSSANTFGERGMQIGGRVYKDPQRDGIDSGGEPGIGGVTVRILQGTTLIATTATAPDGSFSFADLPAGTYSVAEDQPAGYGSSTPNSFVVTIVAGGNQSLAFGETVSSIAGAVFIDGSDDGLRQSPAEAGIPGVVVTLTGTDAGGAAVTRTATTGANGNWSIGDLLSGTYTLTETQPATYGDGKDSAGTSGGTVANDVISDIALATGTDATAYAFGERGQGLTGHVYDDRNRNGRSDGPDTPIAGVALQLQRPDGSVVAATVTDSSGNYSFADIEAGDYVLVEDQPAGYGDAAENTANRKPFTVVVNTAIDPVNFGELTGSLSGLVYNDSDRNGQRGSAEPIIPGVTITLSGTTARGENICTYLAGLTPQGSCTTVTDATGQWRFAGLPGGTYAVAETQPANYGDGADLPGSAGGTLGNDTITAIALPAGADATGYLFGEQGADGQISGTVWFDKNHDRVRDSNEDVKSGWTVQLLLGNTVIATTTTGPTGGYSFAGIAPGTGYRLRFTAPEGVVMGGARTNEDASTANPGNASIVNGEIANITLRPGAAVPMQSLPLDPSGVVYDSVRRVPVAGASVTISGPAGFDPALHLLGGTANLTQHTGAEGYYQFLLTASAPAGRYSLSVTPPNGSYNPIQPSTIIAPCPAGLAIGSTPDPWLVSLISGAPANGTATGCTPHAASTAYFLGFDLVPGVSANVINNNIPIDPVLKGAIVVTKVTPKVNVSRGELVPYTITARNTLNGLLTGIAIADRLPAGFQYRVGSARIDGIPAEPVQTGRVLSWGQQSFPAQAEKKIDLLLVVGAGVGEGEHVNQAYAINTFVDTVVSDVAEATVRIVPDPDFDCTDIIGKVFDDRNANGMQDEGEPGLPGVRLATVNGLLITTDHFGRYHVTCPMIPNEARGSNFILKLDVRTLPSGYRITSGNPETVRLTRGKFATLNFGASLHRVVRADVTGAAFDGDAVKDAYRAQVKQLLVTVAEKPSVLRIAYARGSEDAALIRRRIDQLTALIRQCWKEDGDRYRLTIEEEITQIGSQAQGDAK